MCACAFSNDVFWGPLSADFFAEGTSGLMVSLLKLRKNVKFDLQTKGRKVGWWVFWSGKALKMRTFYVLSLSFGKLFLQLMEIED
jgi:hypothetical protein